MNRPNHRPNALAALVPTLASSLVPAVVLAGLCGPAAAQSSVTLFGVIDANVGRYTGAPTGVNATDKAIKRVESGGMSTSFWGLRGSEDLGGGTSAVFELTGFIRNDTGASGRNDAIGAPVNVAADPFWARNSWVGLASRDYGRIRLGNMGNPLWINSITSNAFGDSTVYGPLNLVTFIGGPMAGGTAWTNQVNIDSPNIAGFVLTAAVSASENQGGRNTGLRLNYAGGPFGASAAYTDVKKNPLTFADGTTANNTRSWQLAASYDFQVVKMFAHLGSIQNKGTETAPLSIRYGIREVSASVPVAAGKVLVGYAQRKTSDAVGPVPATAAGGNVQRKVLTAGYDYSLSKRTDVYLMLMRDQTVTSTVAAPPRLVSASATNLAVGIRHSF
jgi:predicted porin